MTADLEPVSVGVLMRPCGRMLVLAPPGIGKTTRVVIPAILDTPGAREAAFDASRFDGQALSLDDTPGRAP